jgi:uncharacterized GH25 family protein
MKQIRYFLVALACAISVSASAHWQWMDKDGQVVFSDLAPPSDVPEKNILKRPVDRVKTTSVAEMTSPATAVMPQSATSAIKLSGIDKELAQAKAKVDEAEAAKRKASDEKVLKAKVENCARTKQAKSSYESGMRIARTNEKGEREILDDAARASELKRIQAIIDSDCH